MKKKKKEDIDDFYPLVLERTCEMCRRDVRGERMWRKKKNLNVGSTEAHRYICKICVPTDTMAKRVFTDPAAYKDRVKELLRRNHA